MALFIYHGIFFAMKKLNVYIGKMPPKPNTTRLKLIKPANCRLEGKIPKSDRYSSANRPTYSRFCEYIQCYFGEKRFWSSNLSANRPSRNAFAIQYNSMSAPKNFCTKSFNWAHDLENIQFATDIYIKFLFTSRYSTWIFKLLLFRAEPWPQNFLKFLT